MRTVENRCEISTAILPLVSSENRKNTSYSARASSAAVGSSRMSNCASRIYARASATFCHSPPERSTPPSNRFPSIWSYRPASRWATLSARLRSAAVLIAGSSATRSMLPTAMFSFSTKS
jgi:hypothetical protein